jgi:hypothetical protein
VREFFLRKEHQNLRNSQQNLKLENWFLHGEISRKTLDMTQRKQIYNLCGSCGEKK